MSGQFYNYASGHTNPNDLVTVSPATNEGSVIMHDRGGFTSGWPDYWAWGRHHQPVTNNGHVQFLCSCYLVIFQYSLPAYGMRPPNFSKPSGISKGMVWGQEDIMHNFVVLDYPESWHKLVVVFPGLFGGERQSRQSRHSRVLLCSLLLSNLEAAVRLCKPSTTKAGWGGGSWREYGELMALSHFPGLWLWLSSKQLQKVGWTADYRTENDNYRPHQWKQKSPNWLFIFVPETTIIYLFILHLYLECLAFLKI